MTDTSEEERRSFVLEEADIITLGKWAVRIEEHYGRPMDMEWAKDGNSGELFIVQARPETVHSRESNPLFTTYRLVEDGSLLTEGSAIGNAITTGEACVIKDASGIERFVDGAILVTGQTDPDWVPIMKRASAIVTDRGGVTSHAAIVNRELGINAVVGTGTGTAVISDGQAITVSCAQGDSGRVHDGLLAYEREETDLGTLPDLSTRLMINIADPANAFKWWRLRADGVGLARMEFVINDLIRVHPMALVYPERDTDAGERAVISELAHGYCEPADYFVETLATGLAKLAAVFHPAPAIVRFSDFKSNEYSRLVGGAAFEIAEENPMIGFRGACRYYDPRYRPGFDLECRAIKRLREFCGFRNVVVMVPFCRTVAEADRVLAVMAENGLARGQEGLEVHMMCEVPSNVVLAREFAARFDGFSIGSNDLTQLVLGADRVSADLAALFDERDDAVKAMIREAIGKAHEAGIKVGICGQGPSNHPDFAAFLVQERIDSISLNPDSFVRAVPVIAQAETDVVRTP